MFNTITSETTEMKRFPTNIVKGSSTQTAPSAGYPTVPTSPVDGARTLRDRLGSMFRRPVTAVIDITVPYCGEVEGMLMVSGAKDTDGRRFRLATLSVTGQNIPLVLAVEPVRESSEWDENLAESGSSYRAATGSTSERARPDRDGAV